MAPRNVEDWVYRAVVLGELEIDSQGRVWRLAARRGDRWTGSTRTVACARRRAEKLSGPYLQVRAMFGGKRANALAHRLVWRHLHGPIPIGMTVNHRNGVKTDNRPENLELATYSEQALHRDGVLGHARDQRGEKNAMARLTDDQCAEIKRRRASGERLAAIALDYGIAYQTVSRIARGDRRALTA